MYLPPHIAVDLDTLRELSAPGLPLEDEVQKKMDQEMLLWMVREVLARESLEWERRHQVLIYAWQGYSQAEIAKQLQCNRSTISRDIQLLSALVEEMDAVLGEADRRFSPSQPALLRCRRIDFALPE